MLLLSIYGMSYSILVQSVPSLQSVVKSTLSGIVILYKAVLSVVHILDQALYHILYIRDAVLPGIPLLIISVTSRYQKIRPPILLALMH